MKRVLKSKGARWAIIAVALVGGFEGLRTTAYRDVVGVPTICYGETKNVQMGDRFTKTECDQMLADRLQEFNDGVNKCLKVDVPDKVRAAFVSLAYNIGVAGFCSSTTLRRANAGDLVAACMAMTRWNKATVNGKLREVHGLTVRRGAERDLCLEGVRGR